MASAYLRTRPPANTRRVSTLLAADRHLMAVTLVGALWRLPPGTCVAIVQCAVSVEASSSTVASSGTAPAVVVVSSHSIGSGASPVTTPIRSLSSTSP